MIYKVLFILISLGGDSASVFHEGIHSNFGVAPAVYSETFKYIFD